MDVITNRLLRQAVPLFTVFAGLVIALAAGALLIFGKDVFIPLALATLMSFALAPIARRFQRWGAPRGLAVLGALLVAIAFVGGISYVVAVQLADLAADLPAYRNTIQAKIAALKQSTGSTGTFERASQVFREILSELRSIGLDPESQPAASQIVTVRSEEIGTLAAIGLYASPLLKPLATAAIVLLFAIFMLAQREDLRNRFIRLLGTEDLQKTTDALDDAGRRLGKLLLTQLALNALFGLAIGLGLWAIGLPSPFLWGIIAGLMRFVPYIGAFIGVALPLAVAFAVDPGWSALIWTIVLFAAIEPVVAHVIEPLLVGRNTGISPVAVLASATLWAFLWGPIGLVLATPMTICLVVIGRHVPRLAFLDVLLGDRPALAPSEILYQRLLAGDPGEATEQARDFLRERARSTYFDEIMLEAMRLGHIDIVRGSVAGDRVERLIDTASAVLDGLATLRGPAPRGGSAGVEASAAAASFAPDRAIASRVLAAQELAPGWTGRTPVAIIAGAHPLDAPVARMLAQLLTAHGVGAKVVAFDAAASGTLPEDGVALVCFSFVEPLSTLHLRLASMQARRRLPASRTLLCIWQQRDPALVSGLSQRLRFDAIATTMTDALEVTLGMATRRSAPR